MRIFTKLSALFLVGGMTFSNATFAQDEIGELLVGSKDDATLLTKAYLEPFFKGFGLGLNSGWTNTGTTKKLGRFEIRVGATGALVPNSAKSFDVTKLGLTSLRPTSSSNVIAPTVAGEEVDGPEMVLYKDGSPVEGTEFKLPQGLNPPAIPAPQLQASIGLIKGFEVTARYVPEIDGGDDFGKISMVGGSVKFQPLRLISKKLNKAMPFDLAVALGYSKLKYSYNLDVQPEDAIAKNPTDVTKDFSNQKFEATFSGINAEAIVSKKLLFFVPFVSVGYMTSTTDLGLRGNYPVTTGFNGVSKTYEVYTNPVSIDQKYVNNLRASAGFGINLFLLHIYGSYNVSTYNYVNVGLGIGFGK
ncbi:DUF6588 family protein [Desertivirga xinjiangensis]|uniref:DUF6588 family protein n=1 Tax=Desertivirga xinjiangensis TaxID=539206 RepID=UPI00210B3629|nr:DUF6588 family protein [Pedobacter xinjiangensis]